MIRVLDDKLLKEIQELIKEWLYDNTDPKDLVYRIEGFMQRKEIEKVLEKKNESPLE